MGPSAIVRSLVKWLSALSSYELLATQDDDVVTHSDGKARGPEQESGSLHSAMSRSGTQAFHRAMELSTPTSPDLS